MNIESIIDEKIRVATNSSKAATQKSIVTSFKQILIYTLIQSFVFIGVGIILNASSNYIFSGIAISSFLIVNSFYFLSYKKKKEIKENILSDIKEDINNLKSSEHYDVLLEFSKKENYDINFVSKYCKAIYYLYDETNLNVTSEFRSKTQWKFIESITIDEIKSYIFSYEQENDFFIGILDNIIDDYIKEQKKKMNQLSLEEREEILKVEDIYFKEYSSNARESHIKALERLSLYFSKIKNEKEHNIELINT